MFESIRAEMLKEDTWNVKIHFDASRVLIQFHQEGNPAQQKKVPGRICLPVYLAVKKRLLGNHFQICLMDRRDAERYSNQVS